MTSINKLPKHIAIIMDGNGRWAQQRKLSRHAGHRAGMDAARKIIRTCGERGIENLTLFAFSSENWQRPQEEVKGLMRLFLTALQNEVKKIHENNARLQFIGDITQLDKKLQKFIPKAEQLTANNTGLNLNIALNYGGRWDITTAAKKIAAKALAGNLEINEITEELFAKHLSMTNLPDPDLFIRTSGEWRISNFLIWQLAYTELYFSDTFWPDFDETALENALHFYANRQRRFGLTSDQVEMTT